MAFFGLSDDQLRQYHEDGFVRVPGFLDAEETALLRHSAETDRVLHGHANSRLDSAGRASKLTLWHRPGDDIYGLIARSHRMVDSAERLLDDEVYHWHSKMMIKEPFTGGAWEWHQDYGYWYNDGCLYPLLTSVLIAVTPATRQNGCLQVIKGSHHLGRINHGVTGNQAGADIERVEQALKIMDLVYCEMTPGEALFFHCNLLHRSDANNSPDPRWSLICCYNARRNSPYTQGEHPPYAQIDKVDDAMIKTASAPALSPDAEFLAFEQLQKLD